MGFLETFNSERDMVIYPSFVNPAGGSAEATTKNNAFQRSVAIGGGKAELIQMGGSFIAQGTGSTSFGIQLKGTGATLAAKSLSFFAMSKAKGTCEGFMVLPKTIAAANNNYFAVTADNPSSKAEIVILAYEDSTVVQLKTPTGNVDITWGNIRYQTSETTINPLATLNTYDMVQVQSSLDLTGAKITATKPIAVFSGNINTFVGLITGGKNHLIEQIPSQEKGLGRTFYAVPFPGRGTSAKIRIKVVATEATTVLKKDNSNTALTTIAKAQEHFTITADSTAAITIKADKNVMVALFAEGRTTTTDRAPVMMILPPQELWRTQYAFSTGRIVDPTDFKHYITIVIATANIANVQIDNAALTSPTWTTAPIPNGATTAMSFTSVLLSKPGLYWVDTTDNAVTFGAYVYGSSASSCAYAWPAGMCFV